MIPAIPVKWMIRGAVGFLLLILSLFIVWQIYGAGRQSVLDDLKGDKIQILRDGKAIDNEVDLANDDGLCGMLGGCELRDGAGSD